MMQVFAGDHALKIRIAGARAVLVTWVRAWLMQVMGPLTVIIPGIYQVISFRRVQAPLTFPWDCSVAAKSRFCLVCLSQTRVVVKCFSRIQSLILMLRMRLTSLMMAWILRIPVRLLTLT